MLEVELPLRLGKHLLIDDVFLHHLGQAFHLGFPTNNVGLILADIRLGLGHLGLGHRDVALFQADLGDFQLVLFVQFRNGDFGQQIALLHHLTDVRVKMVDEPGYLGKNRRLLEGVHPAGRNRACT